MKISKNETLNNRTLLGPWKVQKAKDTQSRLAIIRDIQGYGVAEMFTRGTEQEQNQVAALIAAAPEMFELLESLYCGCSNLYPHANNCFMIKVESILKKARGE